MIRDFRNTRTVLSFSCCFFNGYYFCTALIYMCRIRLTAVKISRRRLRGHVVAMVITNDAGVVLGLDSTGSFWKKWHDRSTMYNADNRTRKKRPVHVFRLFLYCASVQFTIVITLYLQIDHSRTRLYRTSLLCAKNSSIYQVIRNTQVHL